MSEHTYTVIVHKDIEDGGFWTDVPALPGAGSQGETVEEALEMTREAIGLMLDYLRDTDASIPDDIDPVECVRQVSISA